MHNSPPVLLIDYIGPIVSAAVFVTVMSLVKEPSRRTFNAIFAAGATGVYLSGGFGPWELLYPAIAMPVVIFRASFVSSHRNRMDHALLLGHRAPSVGNPIWPFMPRHRSDA